MSNVTEVTTLFLKPGLDLSRPENQSKVQDSIRALKSQPGFRLLREGQSNDQQELLVWLIGVYSLSKILNAKYCILMS